MPDWSGVIHIASLKVDVRQRKHRPQNALNSPPN
jgi:hypothetical protein